MIKLRMMRLAGHVTRMGRREMHIGVWWGNPKGKRPLGRPKRRRRIIVIWVFEK
jgi:hypothetical protein